MLPQVAQVLRVATPLVRVALPLLRVLPCLLRTVAPQAGVILRNTAPFALTLRLLASLYAGLIRWHLAALDGVITLEERRAICGVMLALELHGWSLWRRFSEAIYARPVVRQFGRAKRLRSRRRHKRRG